MSGSAGVRATERSALPTLDAPTTQAVLELQKAIRELRRLERVNVRDLSPTRFADHTKKIEKARWGFREARLGLERLLEEDA